MSTYTYEDLEGIWIRNGGSPAAAPVAAAVAMAESQGNSDAVNRNNPDGSTDWGLWQINSVHGAQATLDPDGNAQAAVAISNNGTNWNPWTTYRSGAYLQYLHGTATAPTATDLATAGGTAASGPDLSTLATGGCLISWPSYGPLGGGCIIQRETAFRVAGAAVMLGGAVVALVGLAFVFKGSAVGRSLTSAGKAFTGAGALVPDADDRQAKRAEREQRSKPPTVTAGGKKVLGRPGTADEEF